MYDAIVKDKQIVNGVDVEEYNATVEAVQTEPEIAKFKFRAANRWVTGAHNLTTVSGLYGTCREIERPKSFVLEKDEPEILLGTDRGANPVEYALAALLGCLTTTLIYHAAALGVELDEVESALEGDTDLRGFLGLDRTVRNGLSEIRVSFNVKSGASPEKVRELIELAQNRSGVFDMLSNGVPIKVDVAV
jgi:uncharacterized OsmC-like protein